MVQTIAVWQMSGYSASNATANQPDCGLFQPCQGAICPLTEMSLKGSAMSKICHEAASVMRNSESPGNEPASLSRRRNMRRTMIFACRVRHWVRPISTRAKLSDGRCRTVIAVGLPGQCEIDSGGDREFDAADSLDAAGNDVARLDRADACRRSRVQQITRAQVVVL